ncbi:MAG: phosphate signaling complex protein PhoU [Acidobacteria bacterium]|nr:phosphate signaling complex protein PhoU [Acidobacteriota bacterium]MCB9399105.1 phosphate signaling complex protein PhoU [Acidobacteriota bacterium]
MAEQHFHREISELKSQVAILGGMVEGGIGRALKALREGNLAMAQEVVESDKVIDEIEVQIEEACLKVLALYQPVARDLRTVITILKVTNDLESMGDLMESIANKVALVDAENFERSPMKLGPMADKAMEMVHKALDCLLQENVRVAREVHQLDEVVDQYHAENHKTVADGINSRGDKFSLAELKLLSVSRALERIADLATHIAEDVIYLVEAKIVRHRKVI